MTIRLSQATRRQIQAQHADAVQRLLQAEALTQARLDETVNDASRRLVDTVVAIGHHDAERTNRSARRAIQEEAARLQTQFATAVRETRAETRKLADGQVELELGLLGAAIASQGLDEPTPPEGEPVDTSSDGSWAVVAAGSMAASWGAAALAALGKWKREGGQAHRLPSALRQASKAVAPRIHRHAVTQAADVYNEHHQARWQSAIRALPQRGPYRSAAVPAEARGPDGGSVIDTGGRDADEIEREQGLPYGWEAAVYDVWSAVLDRRTCPVCSAVDGHMVPAGKVFPSTAAGRPPEHPHCRCVIVTVIVPEALRKRLPGMQIDYAELKADIQEYFRGSSLQSLSEGKRHARDYIRDTLAGRSYSGRPGTSPEALTRKLQNRRGYRISTREGRQVRVSADPRRSTPGAAPPRRHPGGSGPGGSGSGGGGGRGGRRPRRYTPEDFRTHGIEASGSYDDLQDTFEMMFGEELSPATARKLIGLGELENEGFSIRQHIYGGDGALNWGGAIYRDGRRVGVILRDAELIDGQVHVHHALFTLESGFKNRGLGPRVLRSAFEEYFRLGVPYVRTEAAMTGQYYWPSIGFRLQDPSKLQGYLVEYATWLKGKRFSPKGVAKALRDIGSIHDLAMHDMPGSREVRTGKAFLNWRGRQPMGLIHLELDLRPESADRKILEKRLRF